MTVGPMSRRLVIAQTEDDWARWRADNTGGDPAARVVSAAQARRMGSYDPVGWTVEIAGSPPDEWLDPILAALRAHGFVVPNIFKGGYPYR